MCPTKTLNWHQNPRSEINQTSKVCDSWIACFYIIWLYHRRFKIQRFQAWYMKNRLIKQMILLFLIKLDIQPISTDIYKISHIHHPSLKVESFNDKNIKQWYRCELYGYSSVTCLLTSNCVRCANPHIAELCPNNNKTPRCTNCSGLPLA